MSQLYFDTSAIVKYYTVEVGSSWIINLLDPAQGHTIILSEIAMAEYGAAIAAKQRAGIINSTEQARALGLFLNHCNTDYNLVAVSREIVERAVSLTQNHRLRGYDAIQLATGLITSETLAAAGITDFIFVSADNNLLQVAQLEGLTVENPNLHP